MISILLVAALATGVSPAARALLLDDARAAARAYAREAASAAPEARRAARYWEGLARLRAGDAEGARAAFAEVAAGDDSWAERARASLGDALAAAGRPAEAVEAYRAYLVLHPGGEFEPWVTAAAAGALARAGRTDEARAFRAEVARRWPRLAGSR